MPSDLSPHEQAALRIFLECHEANQWHFIGGDMGPARRVALRMSYAESTAKSYGIAWTHAFRARLTECARHFLAWDAKVQAAEADNEKFRREHGGAVN
jgi:hypothetical protein